MFEGSVLLFEAITFITTGTIIFKFIMNIGFFAAGTQKFILYTLTEKNKLTNKQANKQTNKQTKKQITTNQPNKETNKISNKHKFVLSSFLLMLRLQI